MAIGNRINLREMLRRAGQEGEPLAKLPLAGVVSPVVIAADYSSLVPQPDPAASVFGGTAVAAAGLNTAIELHSRAPGGCLYYFHCDATGFFWYWIPGQTASALTGAAASVGSYRLHTRPSEATVLVEAIAVIDIGAPLVDRAFKIKPERFFWLPPHDYVVFQYSVANAGATFVLVVQDCPAAEQDPSA